MSQSGNADFSLPPSVTIENIEALANEIRTLGFGPAGTLTLDAAAIEMITTPGVQLLLSLHKTLSESGGKLAVKNSNESFAQPFQALGFGEHLSAWSGAHA
jgi:anti-anti-sigma regulatory factor